MGRLREILLCVMLTLIGNFYAQELKLESVAMETMTQTVPIQRKDLNGQVCALVKVIMPGEKVVFEGSVIGECPYKTSEYWCYLSPGTKSLKIKYPNLPPLLVDFTEYFGSGVKSNRIYDIVIKVPINNRDLHKGPLKGSFRLEEPKDVQLYYIHSSTGKRDLIPLQEPDSVFYHFSGRSYSKYGDQSRGIIFRNFFISEAHEGDSLILATSNKAYVSQSKDITVKDIVNGTISLNYPQKKKRKSFKVSLYDCINKDTLPEINIGLFVKKDNGWKDYIETFFTRFANNRNNPDEMCKYMEIDKTYVVKFDHNDAINNHHYRGLWDWNEEVVINPLEESDVIIKVRPYDTPSLNFWIGTKENGCEIQMNTMDNALPEYYQWQNKSDKYHQGSFYNFQGFPILFPATFNFSSDGYRTMQITFYDNPPSAYDVWRLKNGKTVFLMHEGNPLEIEYYEYRKGRLRKK